MLLGEFVAKEAIKKTPDDTKELLIEAAKHLFAKKGFAGTSVKDIADRAEVNVSLISYHFGGKENLYRACLEPFVEEKIRFFERNILRPSSAEDFRFRLKLFIEEVIKSEFDQHEPGCIIRRDVEMDDPIIMEIFKKTIAKLFEQLVTFFKSGQEQGYLRDDLDARTVSLLFMGGIQHALRTDNLRKKFYGITLRDEKQRKIFIETSLEMFFNGFKTNESKDKP
jgi:AcrR family transcriptional regulator